ncbi:MAG: uL15 family ribosomal protein [archaeon]
MKLKKTKKSVGHRGGSTHGHGARKKWRKSGHKGGVGMAGSGKRADQKKTLITKLYGNNYFGKQGITSRGTERKKVLKINLKDIEKNYDNLMKKFGKNEVLDLREYKLLGEGELTKKVKLKVKEASKKAIEGVKKAGGEVEVLRKKEESTSNPTQNKESEKIKQSTEKPNPKGNKIIDTKKDNN